MAGLRKDESRHAYFFFAVDQPAGAASEEAFSEVRILRAEEEKEEPQDQEESRGESYRYPSRQDAVGHSLHAWREVRQVVGRESRTQAQAHCKEEAKPG